MRVSLNAAAFRETTAREYALRFIFGGAITAVAGIIANKYGPVVGGLFLAFPAIFPASATLLEAHQKEKRRFRGSERVRKMVGLDAAGAAYGGLGLFGFAMIAWFFIARHRAWWVLPVATGTWLLISVTVWRTRRSPKQLLTMFRRNRGSPRPIRKR